MNTSRPETTYDNFDVLNLWGGSGRMSFSLKNSYPRLSYFHREEKGKFITAPMDALTALQLSNIIKLVARSKEDVKYSIVCKTRDYNTKEIILQSIIVVARRGDDILLGLKPTHDAKANTVKIGMPMYHEVSKNDEASSTDRIGNTSRAIEYADVMREIILKHALDNKDRIPNSERANPSSPPVGVPVAKVDDIDDYVPAPPEGETAKVSEGDDIDF